MTADGGATLCNRPDAQKEGLGAAYVNPSLSRIMIYVAYLKRLIGSNVIREGTYAEIVIFTSSLRVIVCDLINH